MVFLNPLLLAGLLLITVPIVIHALSRNRFRVEPFGAMLFLRQAVAIKAGKLRLRHLFLLLLRCLLIALLAVSLARPAMKPRGNTTADEPTTHVILLDGSLSMAQGRGADNAFHRARQAALNILDDMGKADNAQVIWGTGRPAPVLPELVFDRVHLQNRIRALSPSGRTIDMPVALEQAFWASEASRLPRRRIYVLTDGQVHDWRLDDESAWERVAGHWDLLQVKPFIYILDQRPEGGAANIAVTDIATVSPLVDTLKPTRFTCELRNFGDDKRRLGVRFIVDGALIDEREVVLEPGGTELHFVYRFNTPGSHYVRVETDGDVLAPDNSLTRAVIALSQVPVLIIEGRSDPNPWKSDAGFLRMALESSTGKGDDVGLFEVVVRPQAEMDACSVDYLRGFRCVILANLTSVSEYFMFALERYAEAGGGVMIAPGEGADAREYERLYNEGRGILPARLDAVTRYRRRYFHPMFPAGQSDGLLAHFDVSRTHVFDNVNVLSFWAAKPTPDASVPAWFDGAPFLVWRPYGQGRTLLWTTSLNPDWTNFPLTRNYLPLVQDLVLHLSATISPPVNVMAGEPILYKAPGKAGSPVPRDPAVNRAGGARLASVTLPNGTEETIEVSNEGGEWIARWLKTDQPGLYTFRPQGLPVRHFGVQTGLLESSLDTLTEADREKLSATPMSPVFARDESLLAARITREVGLKEWWQPMALAVVLLVCLDTLASWRFSL